MNQKEGEEEEGEKGRSISDYLFKINPEASAADHLYHTRARAHENVYRQCGGYCTYFLGYAFSYMCMYMCVRVCVCAGINSGNSTDEVKTCVRVCVNSMKKGLKKRLIYHSMM